MFCKGFLVKTSNFKSDLTQIVVYHRWDFFNFTL